jgi:succinoglycan biosynthesis protein ExoM
MTRYAAPPAAPGATGGHGGPEVAVDVTIAIPTFHRNEDLLELVPMLLEQAAAVSASGRYAVQVLIIDNDPDGGAERTVRSLAGRGGESPLRYVHEREPGLAAVRNRALDESGSSRLLACMDDDGRPAPDWLGALVRTWEATGAAAVAGRVLEHYESTPDPWIVQGGFFRRRSLPTMTEVEIAPAGNLMLDLDQVRARALRFDLRFGLSGGEDTLFTRQLTAAGGRIVWCDESRVVDQVPTNRLTRRWVLARAWSHGNTWSLVNQAMAPDGLSRTRARVRGGVDGAARVAGGVATFAAGLVLRDVARQAKGLRTAYRGGGMLAGAAGRVVEEYAR